MKSSATVAAVDLGASSGRVMLGRVVDGRVTLHESNRFRNGPIRVGDTLWQAEGDDAPEGTRVRVKSVNDAVLMVERASTS